jgi:hypothetical protein
MNSQQHRQVGSRLADAHPAHRVYQRVLMSIVSIDLGKAQDWLRPRDRLAAYSRPPEVLELGASIAALCRLNWSCAARGGAALASILG